MIRDVIHKVLLFQLYINFLVQIGNAWIDDNTSLQGMYDYYWTHALNSDETHAGIQKYCDFITGNFTNECLYYTDQGDEEIGDIDIYNIYAPQCHSSGPISQSVRSVSPLGSLIAC